MIVIINYAPLWKTMKEKGVSQYRLLKSGINNRTVNYSAIELPEHQIYVATPHRFWVRP